ncbi:MAG: hypothetical protein AABX14_05025 [Candidatus Aenigmatarchaeota archaeon]
MDSAIAFGIGMGIVAGGIFLADNAYAYKFVRDTATRGIREVEGHCLDAHRVYRRITPQQATDYLEKSSEPIMSRIGFNFARKVYQV